MNKAVFLDRDGVLNQAIIKNGKPYPPSSLDELTIHPGTHTALTILKAQGFLLIGITNQPDVARGQTSKNTVEAINQQLLNTLPLDDIRVCYHDDKDDCICRKPKPGLIHQAVNAFSVNLEQSFMIGDRWKDIVAANAAPCRSIWLKTNYAERHPEDMHYTANDLLDAVEWINKQN